MPSGLRVLVLQLPSFLLPLSQHTPSSRTSRSSASCRPRRAASSPASFAIPSSFAFGRPISLSGILFCCRPAMLYRRTACWCPVRSACRRWSLLARPKRFARRSASPLHPTTFPRQPPSFVVLSSTRARQSWKSWRSVIERNLVGCLKSWPRRRTASRRCSTSCPSSPTKFRRLATLALASLPCPFSSSSLSWTTGTTGPPLSRTCPTGSLPSRTW
mmetsp:Transcript_955/g.2924  ORF Transcript_955/g.2924 Transcript_955/m.2924 type:complete len:216 (+) Transcript_955:272-919(+)